MEVIIQPDAQAASEVGARLVADLIRKKREKGTKFYAYFLNKEWVEDPIVPDNSKWKVIFDYVRTSLVPPADTPSTINAVTYAVSKWIDLGRMVDRPKIGGKSVPYFWVDPPYGFRGGVERLIEGKTWLAVDTGPSGYVKNSHYPPTHPDSNDIRVDSPDKGEANLIPLTNEVAIQFQATDAVSAGSKIPNEDPALVNDDTWTHELESLSGKQFVRYRIRFNVAKGTDLNVKNPKPQVNFTRLRLKY